MAAGGPALAADPPVAERDPIALPQPLACPTGTRSSREYAFSLMGNRAGYQTVCLQADGTRVVHFAYNDRGRGPALTSKIHLDAKNVPVAITTDGNDYLKSPVAKRFTRTARTPTRTSDPASSSTMAPRVRLRRRALWIIGSTMRE